MIGAARVGRLAILGCGHIGGSFGLALKEAGVTQTIVGYDVLEMASARARSLGICDEVAATPEDAVRGAELIVLATPVRATVALAKSLATQVSQNAIVTDVGSTKVGVVNACEEAFGTVARFVGGHPLAGTERSGPGSATAKLFLGKRVFLTPTPRTDSSALWLVTKLWQTLGAQVVEIGALEHDRAMAAVSHLPHVAAYALAGVLAERGYDDLIGLTAGGFLDTTRVASTAPAMWVDVMLENQAMLLPLVELLRGRLDKLRDAISAGDAETIRTLLTEARKAREGILGR